MVDAQYTRHAEDGTENLQARFVQVLLPNGSFEDRVDEDPDFLTVLNQPFAIQLDAPTLHDLRALRGAVPFQASSPLGGNAVLRGFLRSGEPGVVDGHEAVGVRFEAEGIMTGSPAGGTAAAMTGQIRMTGTAYYGASRALLLGLDETLDIAAQLKGENGYVPVHIVYRRWIRANAKTLQPTPLPSGGGTGYRAKP
ncbi:MAG TPA: hypothetical protein VMH02_07905 [Verrucomicrobiae bacterium]|nr:hypothetical protein [Verrucomicrobiae bacterium]